MSRLPEIVREFDRVSPEVVARVKTFQAAILADVAGRRGTMHARVAPVDMQMVLAGMGIVILGRRLEPAVDVRDGLLDALDLMAADAPDNAIGRT